MLTISATSESSFYLWSLENNIRNHSTLSLLFFAKQIHLLTLLVFTAVSYSGGSVLLPEWRSTAKAHRSSRGRVPRGTGVLPHQRRDDPAVQGERRIPHGEEESIAGQTVAEESLAFLRGTGELKGSQGITYFQTSL